MPMERLVADLARSLVDNPDAVRVEAERRDDVTVLRLTVADTDRGQIIGRGGRIVRSLRTIVRAGGVQSGERYVLELVE
ncbi:MAG: KH domain-containing protein [Gaiellales bacterium]